MVDLRKGGSPSGRDEAAGFPLDPEGVREEGSLSGSVLSLPGTEQHGSRSSVGRRSLAEFFDFVVFGSVLSLQVVATGTGAKARAKPWRI